LRLLLMNRRRFIYFVHLVISKLRLIFLLVATALLPGCGSKDMLEKTVDQNFPIDPNGAISLTNVDGSIQIYGAHKPGLHLQAIKKAYSAARLNKIDIHIDAKPSSIDITTTFPPSKRWSISDRSGTVDYIVILPASCTISRADLENGEILVAGMDTGNANASLRNGRVFVRNCFGNATASAQTGALTLIYDWWEQRKFYAQARMTDGNIFAVIPSDASFRLHAEAPNGKIGNDFAEKVEQTRATVTRVDSVVGDSPEAAIDLVADDGNIKIVEANP
jgi:hypothetical protein